MPPPPPPPPSSSSRGEEPGANEPRKRRSRWGDAEQKLPGLPVTVIGGNVSASELDSYAVHVRLEEINRKLSTGDVVPPERMRSPSPPPTYDGQGRRTNTREIRYRKRLEDERTRLVERALKADPNFRPPMEYQMLKRNTRPQEKVYIPKDEFPEINFFGLLVGPRGNSLKKMEAESGAKISIRGKGSVKPGKERNDQYGNDEHEELHCLVMADSQDKVDRCVALINKVIETAASTPEGQNDHKRNQLRELASLNGTLRDDENQLCQNCGEKGHRRFECPQARNFSANVICRQCGGAGHMARDCFQKGGPAGGFGGPNPSAGPKTAFDSEYQNLMNELGEGGGGSAQGPVRGAITANGEPGAGGEAAVKIPPWRIPENWFSNSRPQGNFGGGGGGYQPQQAQGGYQGYGQAQAGAGGYDYSQAGANAWGGAQQAYGGQDAYAAYYASLQQQQQ
ncbi:hypothetical protein NliqN6_5606 [Naganishia liquefaciens]|uniref:Branchpoint-bridging protein n=1 Tax=Naganishia liquefaciens TaxID=104408 RepID=A0A8H3TY12_9TREE|nr:hypothetical protein NliqN6_5606 [Naganishia liquefaciens]